MCSPPLRFQTSHGSIHMLPAYPPSNDSVFFSLQVMDVKVLEAAKAESVLKTATFAGGCFWGVELAFQRAKGVVSTKVQQYLRMDVQPAEMKLVACSTFFYEARSFLFLD